MYVAAAVDPAYVDVADESDVMAVPHCVVRHVKGNLDAAIVYSCMVRDSGMPWVLSPCWDEPESDVSPANSTLMPMTFVDALDGDRMAAYVYLFSLNHALGRAEGMGVDPWTLWPAEICSIRMIHEMTSIPKPKIKKAIGYLESKGWICKAVEPVVH